MSLKVRGRRASPWGGMKDGFGVGRRAPTLDPTVHRDILSRVAGPLEWICSVARSGHTAGMRKRLYLRLTIAILWAAGLSVGAQAPDVPVYRQGRQESQYEDQIRTAARDLFARGSVIRLTTIQEQLKHTSCELDLPAPATRKLAPREICAAARRSHFRVGWVFLCTQCEDWHVNLAGGYALTTNGAIATCYHVVQPDSKMKMGCLVAADESGKVFGVTEVLAANRYSDVLHPARGRGLPGPAGLEHQRLSGRHSVLL